MTPHKMHSVSEGMNKFCGPAVLSIVTGKNTDECADAISRVSGKYTVTGVTIDNLIKAAKLLRVTIEPMKTNSYMLFGAASQLSYHPPGMYIVLLKGHFVCIEVTANKQVLFCDNHTKEPIDAASAARMSSKVFGVYKATPREEPVFLRSEFDIEVTKDILGYLASVIRHEVYKLSEDDKRVTLAHLRVRTKEDLEYIINQLSEKVKDV